MSKKIRVDTLLFERGLVESREKGKRLLMAGEVVVNGQLVDKPGTMVDSESQIDLKAKPKFASRGGEKLEAALEAFQIDVSGFVCADVGVGRERPFFRRVSVRRQDLRRPPS